MNRKSNVLVLGAGLIGLTTAYYLTKAGFKVTIIDREAQVARGASFANGGMLTPSMSEPWNTPGVHWQLFSSLGKKDAALLLRLNSLHQYISWGLRFIYSSTTKKFHRATLANIQLSKFSLNQQNSIDEECDFNYEQSQFGTMKVFRNLKSFRTVTAKSDELREHGLQLQELDANAAESIEPSLNQIKDQIEGAIFYPDDAIGNARIFCESMKTYLMEKGCTFALGEAINSLIIHNGNVVGVKTDGNDYESQKVVVCLGAWTSLLLKNTSLRIPIRPAKGYSVTTDVGNNKFLPKIAIVDDDLHAAITPLGGKVRLAGTAEFSGWNTNIDESRINNLWNFFSEINPGLYESANRESAESWCGLRPLSADGLPVIGATPINGLYINAGHGPLGWSQAAGSSALLCQIIKGEKTPIDNMPYAYSRFM